MHFSDVALLSDNLDLEILFCSTLKDAQRDPHGERVAHHAKVEPRDFFSIIFPNLVFRDGKSSNATNLDLGCGKLVTACRGNLNDKVDDGTVLSLCHVVKPFIRSHGAVSAHGDIRGFHDFHAFEIIFINFDFTGNIAW